MSAPSLSGGVSHRDPDRLITRFQAGEAAAFDELYRRFFDQLCTYFRVILDDSHEAEDCAQEVFVRVRRALPTYEIDGRPFEVWLFRIARNLAIDNHRAQRPVELHEPGKLRDLLESRSYTGELSQLGAMDWISHPELLVAIQELPLDQRQVLTLRYLMDFTPAEIAEILDQNPDWVRQNQHRALRFLEQRLKESDLGRWQARRHEMSRIPRDAPVLRNRRLALCLSGRVG